jgi:hypothetical protein
MILRPSTTDAAGRAERLAPWLVGVLFAAPILLTKYPPMVDLPLHEASVGLLRHWGDPAFSPKSVYFLNLGHSNQLFSLLVLAVSYVLPIGLASKTVVAAAMLALPLAAARFADHVGASRWTVALVAAPIGFGWLFFWGLIQNIVGLIALLAVLPAIDRFAAEPTARRAAGVCAAMVLLHFAHQAMQLVACAALIFCCVGTSLRARALALRAVPLLFSLALVYAASVYAWSHAGPRNLRMQALTFYDVGQKVTSISAVLFGGYEPWVRNSMLVLALAPMAILAAGRPRPGAVHETLWQRLHAWRFEALGGTLVLIYLVAPANIRSTTLVYHRFMPPAWAILAICCGARPGRPDASIPRLVPVLCAVLPVASLLIGWPSFADSHRMYSDLETLIDLMDPGCAIAAVNLGHDPANRLWNPVDAMGHVVAERGGRSLFDYTQSPVSPVAQRPDKQWADVVDRTQHRPFALRPAWDLTRFRYLLIDTPDRALAAAVTIALRHDARFVAAKGDWYLYESRLPLVPIDADDAPLPASRPPTLRAMLKSTVEEMRAAESGAGPVPEIPLGHDDVVTNRPESP